MSSDLDQARALIRDVPNFPKTGIMFRDITPLLTVAKAMRAVTEALAEPWRGKVTHVCGIEARGFIFGALLAQELGCAFVPLRKPGRLPFKTESVSYGLEYGTDQLEIHIDAFPSGAKVLVSDDLLATGGTAHAASTLIERVGAKTVGYSFAIELADLGGRSTLPSDCPAHALFSL